MTRTVVFDISGLSIRSAGCFGNVEAPTPLLDEFAAQAMLFEQHYRHSTDTADDLRAALASFPDRLPVSYLCHATIADADTAHQPATFETVQQLPGLLEHHLESETAAAWVRIAASHETVNSAFPLPLIPALVEQGVQVAITSTTPTPEPTIRDEAAIRVPLMVWTGDPSRVQTVTSSLRLADVLGLTPLADHTDETEFAVIQSTTHIAMREPASLVIASRSLLDDLSGVGDDQLAERLDMTGDQLLLFRKPEDVWNVHSVLVEEPGSSVEALSRLRRQLVT